MTDSAKGPSAGYIYQFERALLLLASLERSEDYISIEMLDDITSHKVDDKIILTIQAKHSIRQNATAFGDSSLSLWRTIQIWIEKLKAGIFSSNTIIYLFSK